MPFDDAGWVRIDSITTELRDARLRIATPERWIKGSFGILSGAGPDRFCLVGSVTGYFDGVGEQHAEALSMISKCIGGDGCVSDIILFNDAPETTHDDVLALLDEAIELSKA